MKVNEKQTSTLDAKAFLAKVKVAELSSGTLIFLANFVRKIRKETGKEFRLSDRDLMTKLNDFFSHSQSTELHLTFKLLVNKLRSECFQTADGSTSSDAKNDDVLISKVS